VVGLGKGAFLQPTTKLPIILYNVPGRTGCNIQPETVATLVRENENIVGLKEATGNMAQASKTMYLCDGKLDLYSGEDGLVVPLMDGLTTADFDYGVFAGTSMTSITHFDAATGQGRLAIAVRLKS
jgi:dihydrodipicolinate synthase/N-acetylneuraminate lyase